MIVEAVAMVAALAGAFARLEPDRLARVVLLGNLLGGVGTTLVLVAGVTRLFS